MIVESEIPTATARGSILIVDDDRATAMLQQRRLLRAGYQAHFATDVDKALEIIEGEPISLMVLDYRLADNHTGLEFYEHLKQRGHSLPTILVTGFSNEALVVQALRAGVRDFVAKSPDYLDYLPHAVRQVLEKVETERRLRDAEALQAVVLEAALDAVVTIDDEGCIVEFSRTAETLFGYERQTVLGQSLAELVIPVESRGTFEAMLRTYRDAGTSAASRRRSEISVIRADGSRFDGEWSLSTTMVGGRRLFAAHIHDLTRSKYLETGLRLRQRALEEIGEGILFTDAVRPDHPIVYANPAFERMTGYRLSDIIGNNCRFLQGPKTDPAAIKQLRQAVAEERSCSVELLNYRADGTTFWNAVSIAPLHDESGKVTHFVGVQSDVGQRRFLEEQLRQSQKMEAVGRLSGGIAHDFNNILTIILGNASLALDDLPQRIEHATECLHEVIDAANRAAALTKQLLVFSRKQVYEPQAVKIDKLTADLEKMLRRIIGEDVLLSLKTSPDLWSVKIDPAQIEQIILNLTVNARDAMPTGGSLMIQTENVELDGAYAALRPDVAPGAYVKLSVSDTGCGIAPEVLPHLFEPFFTTKELGRGTGLGLATVFGIVKQCGGHITVYSEVGQGSVFTLYFPRDQSTPRTESQPSSAAKSVRGTEKILLVEDEEQVRRLAAVILRNAGYQVVEAADGPQALQLAESQANSFDLVVTDVVMPGVNGRQTADMLKAKSPLLKVLFVSGYTNDAIVTRGVLQEGTAFLQKPFTQSTLLNKVRHVLDA